MAGILETQEQFPVRPAFRHRRSGQSFRPSMASHDTCTSCTSSLASRGIQPIHGHSATLARPCAPWHKAVLAKKERSRCLGETIATGIRGAWPGSQGLRPPGEEWPSAMVGTYLTVRPEIRNIVQCASSQLSPIPKSTSSGICSSAAPSISRRIFWPALSTNTSSTSNTSSSCTCMIIRTGGCSC